MCAIARLFIAQFWDKNKQMIIMLSNKWLLNNQKNKNKSLNLNEDKHLGDFKEWKDRK